MTGSPESNNPELPPLEAQVAEILDNYEQTGSVTDIFHAHQDNAYPEYWQEGVNDGAYIEALAALPARNSSLACEVYRTFAESPNPRDRRAIVIYLTKLCLADRAAGFELWDHLVRDPEARIREDAIHEIREHIEYDESSYGRDEAAEAERMRQESVGLTWQDITHLYRAYLVAVQRPSKRYEPGLTAIQGND